MIKADEEFHQEKNRIVQDEKVSGEGGRRTGMAV